MTKFTNAELEQRIAADGGHGPLPVTLTTWAQCSCGWGPGVESDELVESISIHLEVLEVEPVRYGDDMTRRYTFRQRLSHNGHPPGEWEDGDDARS